MPVYSSDMATTAKSYGTAKVFLLHKRAGLEFAVVYLYCVSSFRWNLYQKICFFLINVNGTKPFHS